MNGHCTYGSNCRNRHDATQRDARARFSEEGIRAVQRGGSRIVEDHAEAVDESMSHIWMPTSIDLQLRQIKSSGGNYWLIFPLELTKKDYLRRILEIVAEGISERVVSASASLHHSDMNNGAADPFPDYPVEYSKFDAQYLLKHIIGQGNPTEKKLKIQQGIALQLHCNYQVMASAAGVLFQSRNNLFHMARGGFDDTDVNVNFNAAVELLQCFGVSASEALMQLNDLRSQYDGHMQFKMRRCALLGWEGYLATAHAGGSDDSDTVSPPPPPFGAIDIGASVDDLEIRSGTLIESIGVYLTPAAKATTSAICMMQGQVEYLSKLCSSAASRAAYEEAGRLNSLQKLVEATIASCSADAWFRELGQLLGESDALILDVGLAEKACKDQKKFAEAACLHTMYGNVKAAKDRLKQSWEKINRQPTPAELGDTSAVTTEYLLYRWGRGTEHVGSSSQNLPSLFRTVHLAQLECAMADICRSWLQGSRIFCNNEEMTYDSGSWSATARRLGGFTAEELSSAFDANDLKGAGYSASDLKRAGYSASDLKGAGYSASDLKSVGYSVSDLKGAGYSASDLSDAGEGLLDLKGAGYSASDLSGVGYTLLDLKGAGYNASDLKGAGYSASDLSWYSASDLKGARYSASDLKGAGYSASDLEGVGYTLLDLKGAGYSTADFRRFSGDTFDSGKGHLLLLDLYDAGYDLSYLKRIGYGAGNLKHVGYSASDLNGAGYSVSDLMGAEYTPLDLKACGYSASDFKPAFLLYVQDMTRDYERWDGAYEHGGSPAILALVNGLHRLKCAGYSASDLPDASDLKHAGYSAYFLKRAGYSTSDLKRAGYSASDLKGAVL